MRYLPIGKYYTDMLKQFRSKIEQMCMADKRNTVFSEDIRQLVEEITLLPIEFPKHLI